jgi:hypothetical protein
MKSWIVLLACVMVVPSCGLVKMPFRVAGAVVDTTYEGGKKAVDATSDVLEKRKKRKEREQAEKDKEEARKAQQGPQPGAGHPPLLPPQTLPPSQEPAIPVGPTDPPLPQ